MFHRNLFFKWKINILTFHKIWFYCYNGIWLLLFFDINGGHFVLNCLTGSLICLTFKMVTMRSESSIAKTHLNFRLMKPVLNQYCTLVGCCFCIFIFCIFYISFSACFSFGHASSHQKNSIIHLRNSKMFFRHITFSTLLRVVKNILEGKQTNFTRCSPAEIWFSVHNICSPYDFFTKFWGNICFYDSKVFRKFEKKLCDRNFICKKVLFPGKVLTFLPAFCVSETTMESGDIFYFWITEIVYC